MSKKTRILCVDDEELIREVMAGLLGDKYDVMGVGSGEECLQAATDFDPELILLDVNMPGMDGLETCRVLKSNPLFNSMPVIFVSARSSEDERIAGYEAGGQEYIVKPFNSDELLIKVSQTLETQQRLKLLERGSRQAQRNEKNAISEAEELSTALAFMRESFEAGTCLELGEKLLPILIESGVEGSFQLKTIQGTKFFSTKGELDPLEVSVFEYAQEHGSIVMKGSKLMLHKGYIKLLISNMPSNEKLAERLKAHVELLLDGTNSRMQALDIEYGLQQQRKMLAMVMKRTNGALVDVVKMAHTQQRNGQQVMDNLLEEMQNAYVRLALEDDQEESINSTLRQADMNLTRVLNNGVEIDDLFSVIMDDIQNILDHKPKKSALICAA